MNSLTLKIILWSTLNSLAAADALLEMRLLKRHKWLPYAGVAVGVMTFVMLTNTMVIQSGMKIPTLRLDWEDDGDVQVVVHEAEKFRQIDNNRNLQFRDINTQPANTASHQTTKRTRKPTITDLIASPTKTTKQVKVICMVKTQPSNFLTKAKVVKNTWGKRCDKTVYISTVANADLPAVGILPGKRESRQLLAQKVFGGLHHVWNTYKYADYDWLMVCDDDTYVIVENLRHFLADKNPLDPVYFGHRFMKYTPQGYSSGGSGYIMSREALRRFGTESHKYKECNQTGQGSDFKVGQCLFKLSVLLGISTDSKGRSRFHCFDLGMHLFGGYPDWYVTFTNDAGGSRINDISDYPISFHYSSNKKMYMMDQLLYHSGVWGLKYSDKTPS